MPLSLASADVETHNSGGAADTADTCIVAGLNTDFSGSVQLLIKKGTPASNSFGASSHTKDVLMTVDLTTGNWTATNGQSGSFTPTQVSNFRTNTLVPLHNQLESIINGRVFQAAIAQVNWT